MPTDFEYVGVRSELSKGWLLDVKPYTYSYYNQQNYAAQPKTGAINLTNCVDVLSKASADSPAVGIQPCGTDKLNSYRKYGEVTTVSQTSRYGVFRTGMWYEWATTSRHQIPQNPITHADDVLPNFNEHFYTNSYQPFVEYEYHATSKLTLTGGFKYAHYNQDLTQYADNGKTIGSRNPVTGVAFTSQHNSVGYNSYLPSADANYRIKSNWSAYGQYATGSIIPPSSVYDVAGAVVLAPPAPTTARTFQGGTVLKLSRMTFNADAYYILFGNTYTAPADPNGEVYTSSGNSVTKGFEGETNIYITHGLSLYANGTAGAARYVSQSLTSSTSTTSTTSLNPNYQAWVANTPANTEAVGLTYQRKAYDVGFFHKRVGPMWNDGTLASGANDNQYIPIAPFNIDNLFVNYTIRSNSHLDGTKLRFSINNLLNTENITSLTAGTTAVTGVPYSPAAGDTLGLTPRPQLHDDGDLRLLAEALALRAVLDFALPLPLVGLSSRSHQREHHCKGQEGSRSDRSPRGALVSFSFPGKRSGCSSSRRVLSVASRSLRKRRAICQASVWSKGISWMRPPSKERTCAPG